MNADENFAIQESKTNMSTIETIVARALNVDVARLTDDVGYQSIAEWDSFAHVNLMLALGEELGIEITNDQMLELSSISAIKSFTAEPAVGGAPLPEKAPPEQTRAAPPSAMIHRGLSGITFDSSAITQIDGDNGRLTYRGYDINALAENATFEETAWLLLEGELPRADELTSFSLEIGNARAVPQPVLAMLEAMRGAHPMDALRTAVSALGALEQVVPGTDDEAAKQMGLQLIAQAPTVIAAHHALRSGRKPVAPDPRLSHAHDFLRMLLGHEPMPELIDMMDEDLVIHADHSANASTFAARVATGCGVGMHAATTAALAAFAGPLHGGAVEQALAQIDRIGAPEAAAAYVRDRQSRNQPVMGFGHRVYRTEDPRVRHFRETAGALSSQYGDTRAFEIVEALVEAMQPFARLGIGPNVDLYAGLIYRLLGLPDDLACTIFAAGRMPGWVAHVLEQRSENILIRPLLHYVGPKSRPFVSLADRDRKLAIELAV